MCERDPAELRRFYIQLVEVEAPFKTSRTICSYGGSITSWSKRIEAHIFVAFLAYCLHVMLRARLWPLAAGLTPRTVLDKLAAIQILDVHFPTTDGRTLILSRYTEPNKRPETPPAATRPHPTVATAAANHRFYSGNSAPATRHVVETFDRPALIRAICSKSSRIATTRARSSSPARFPWTAGMT